MNCRSPQSTTPISHRCKRCLSAFIQRANSVSRVQARRSKSPHTPV